MSEHLVLGAGEGDRWIILQRDYSDRWNVFSTARASLEGMVNFLIETLQKHPSADMTFSTRPVAQVRADLVEDAAAVRTAAPGASLHIMAPAGSFREPWRSARLRTEPVGHSLARPAWRPVCRPSRHAVSPAGAAGNHPRVVREAEL
jgi:hypothetical protein